MPGATIRPLASISFGSGMAVEMRQLRHLAVADPDVDPPPRQAGAVDDHAAPDDRIVIDG
jgi:hypothetical protein